MHYCRFTIAAFLSLVVWASETKLAEADTFKITAKNLNGTPILKGEQIYLRAFLLEKDTTGRRTITVDNVKYGWTTRIEIAGEKNENGITALNQAGLASGTTGPHVVFDFTINRSNPAFLVAPPDSMVIFEFFKTLGAVLPNPERPQAETPFIVISTDNKDNHKFSVAVPEPKLEPPVCPPAICLPEFCPSMPHPSKTRCRLFRR